jgi:hypothetical protein
MNARTAPKRLAKRYCFVKVLLQKNGVSRKPYGFSSNAASTVFEWPGPTVTFRVKSV